MDINEFITSFNKIKKTGVYKIIKKRPYWRRQNIRNISWNKGK